MGPRSVGSGRPVTIQDAAPVDAGVFAAEVERTIVLYEIEIGRAASRTRRMIERYGEVEALGRLMVSADLQKGFKVLRDKGQLGNTFEALVLRFEHMFRREAIEAARWRLNNPDQLLE